MSATPYRTVPTRDELLVLVNARVRRAVLEGKTLTLNAQTGTTYTLALTDAGEAVTLTNAGAITLTIPTNTTAAFDIGTQIVLVQGGAGTVTVAPAGGVTMNSLGAANDIAGQWGVARLLKTATNTWVLSGDIA